MKAGQPLAQTLRGVRPFPASEADAAQHALETFIASARAAWPEVQLNEVAFARFVGSRIPRDGTVTAALTPLAAGDLLLAWASLEGRPSALVAFDASLCRAVAGVCRGRAFHGLRDELEQLLRHKLLVEPPRKLSQYSGRGAMDLWLRAVATRTAISLTRGSEKEVPHDERDERALGARDPELQFIQAQHQKPFRLAFKAALEAMTADQRTLLRLHFVEGLSHEQIARLECVHQTTVTRRIAASRVHLLAAIRDELSRRLRLKPGELDSLVRGARSQLDVSLSALLPADAR